MTSYPIEAERLARIRQLLDAGETYETIAQEMGLTRQRIGALAKRLGYTPRRRNPTALRAFMDETGLTPADVAAATGYDTGYVYNLAGKHAPLSTWFLHVFTTAYGDQYPEWVKRLRAAIASPAERYALSVLARPLEPGETVGTLDGNQNNATPGNVYVQRDDRPPPYPRRFILNKAGRGANWRYTHENYLTPYAEIARATGLPLSEVLAAVATRQRNSSDT